MEKLHTIFWIIAYSLTGADILLGLVIFGQKRDRKVLAFLFFLINIFLISLFSFLYSVSLIGYEVFAILLDNGLLLLYLVLPNLLYAMNELKFQPRGFLILYALAVFTLNLLIFFGISVFPYFYMFYWIPFFVTGFLLNKDMKIQGVKTSGVANPFYFYKALKSAWTMTGIVAVLMGVSSLVVFFLTPFSSGFGYSAFFAIFYILFSLPSLVFFSIRLFWGSSDEAVLDELTEREKEVANRIMEGKKYREIGDELFISLSTVKKHANNIYRKTGTNNGRDLIRLKLSTKRS